MRTSMDFFGQDASFKASSTGGCEKAVPELLHSNRSRQLDSRIVSSSVGCFADGGTISAPASAPKDQTDAADAGAWYYSAIQSPPHALIITLRERTVWEFTMEMIGRVGGAFQICAIALGVLVFVHRTITLAIMGVIAKKKEQQVSGADVLPEEEKKNAVVNGVVVTTSREETEDQDGL